MGRSRRKRAPHSVYQSLNQNQLSTRIDDFTASPRKTRSGKNIPEADSYQHSYKLRRDRTTEYVNEDEDFSEDEDDSLTPMRQRSSKRRKIESGGDEDEFADAKFKKGKSKRVQEDDEDEHEVKMKPTPRRSTRFAKNVAEDINEKENGIDEDLTASRKRGRPRKLTIESKQDGDDDEEEGEKEDLDEEMTEKSRESTAEPRQYHLREKRTPVDRLSSHMDRPRRKAAPVMFSRQRFVNNSINRRNLREKRKRRYSSSSTSSSDEELTNAKRDAKDESKFQRRIMRSMNQSRQNLLPINMTEKDLSGSKHLVKERLRQIAEPENMKIDAEVRFDQVGGCTSHLQSLKETVLFPLIYPELFEKFKITPPKGILFYGPPGTGKTLIARALANECSQGDKKVAFFMRKGAGKKFFSFVNVLP